MSAPYSDLDWSSILPPSKPDAYHYANGALRTNLHDGAARASLHEAGLWDIYRARFWNISVDRETLALTLEATIKTAAGQKKFCCLKFEDSCQTAWKSVWAKLDRLIELPREGYEPVEDRDDDGATIPGAPNDPDVCEQIRMLAFEFADKAIIDYLRKEQDARPKGYFDKEKQEWLGAILESFDDSKKEFEELGYELVRNIEELRKVIKEEWEFHACYLRCQRLNDKPMSHRAIAKELNIDGITYSKVGRALKRICKTLEKRRSELLGLNGQVGTARRF